MIQPDIRCISIGVHLCTIVLTWEVYIYKIMNWYTIYTTKMTYILGLMPK